MFTPLLVAVVEVMNSLLKKSKADFVMIHSAPNPSIRVVVDETSTSTLRTGC
jgi:hypothetical protein